jgi:hypothetical protein
VNAFWQQFGRKATKARRQVRYALALTVFVLFCLAGGQVAEARPSPSERESAVPAGLRREAAGAEKMAVLVIGTLSLMASITHRIHTNRSAARL